FHSSLHLPHLHSFPTRRSSDLGSTPIAHHGRAHLVINRRISSRNCPSVSRKPGSTSLGSSTTGAAPGTLAARLANSCALAIRLRSEEHTSELQSRFDLVCRLLL